MKIINLKAENIKRLKLVDITPEDNTIIVSGKNGQGKTSLLDCIFWALEGAKNIQENPIREGEDAAYIKLDLGKLKIERKFTQAKPDGYLTVTTEEGARYGNPQEIINKLLGAISLDPLAFTRMDKKEQAATLRGLIKSDYNFEDADAKIKKATEDRRDTNRDIKQLESQVAGYSFPEDTPDEQVIIADLSKSFIEKRDNNSKATQANNKVVNITRDIETLEEELKKKKAQLETATAESEAAKKLVTSDEDLKKIESEIAEADKINANVAIKKQKAAKQKELDEKTAASETFSKTIDNLNAEKKEALEKAEVPVKGLELQEGTILFNGLPLEQASSAGQTRIATAIAMALNPQLRVIRIKDGALLDPDSMNMLKAMVKENDFQLWIERVGEEPLSVVIEDGRVKGAPIPEPAPEAKKTAPAAKPEAGNPF